MYLRPFFASFSECLKKLEGPCVWYLSFAVGNASRSWKFTPVQVTFAMFDRYFLKLLGYDIYSPQKLQRQEKREMDENRRCTSLSSIHFFVIRTWVEEERENARDARKREDVLGLTT